MMEPENKYKKWLFNEGTFIISIIVGVVAFINYFQTPTQANADRILILEGKMERLNELPSKVDGLKIEVTSLRTTIEERLPKK